MQNGGYAVGHEELIMPPRLAPTTLLTKATDAVAVVDAYAKPIEQAAQNALAPTAVNKALDSVVNGLTGASKDPTLLKATRDAIRGNVDKGVALDRLKDVVGSSVLSNFADPKDIKNLVMGDLLKSAGFKLDVKNLAGRLGNVKSLKSKLEDVKSKADKYASFGIKFGNTTHCSNSDGKGLLDMLNGALGVDRFKGIDFDVKFGSLGNLFDKIPDLGVDGLFEEMMDVFEPAEEAVSFLGKGLKNALKNMNLPHLKMSGDLLGGFKMGAEFPNFSLDFLKGYKKSRPKCDMPGDDSDLEDCNEMKDLLGKVDPSWDKYTRDDSSGVGSGDGTGGSGIAAIVHNLEPFANMSDRAKELLRNDPDEEMRINVLIADNYKSVRLTHLAKSLYPGVAF